MIGVVNLPVRNPSFTNDDMTMKVIGIRQEVPHPGKLALMRKSAATEARQAAVVRDSTRLAVIRNVRTNYYELAYIDAALDIARRTHATLLEVATVAERRYAAGRGEQQDVIRATLEATRVNETVNGLIEMRAANTSKLSAFVGTAVTLNGRSRIPESIVRIAGSANADSIHFATSEVGSTAVGSPLLPLADVQNLALRNNRGIEVRELEQELAGTRASLARKERLPDFDVSVEYGQRSGRSMESGLRRADMVSVTVSMPLPIQQSTRQRPLIRAAIADAVSAANAQRAAENMLRAEVARLYSEVERNYTLLALYRKALLPQGRAAITASTGAYRSGTGSFVSVLEAQSTALQLELSYERALADFAQRLAELEEVAGTEVLR
jgi:outer membrane protein TolC